MSRLAMISSSAIAISMLTGCATGPSHDAVRERILIEFEGVTGLDTSGGQFDEMADGAATSLESGYCGEPGYFVGLSEAESLRDALLITCMTYYRDQMTPGLIDQATGVILRQARDAG